MNVAALTTDASDQRASSLLRTLLLCDLVESTALVERLGDRAAAELIRKHDRLARTIADRHGGREIDKTDGFLMMFDRPIQAVAFALDYQRGLKQLNAAENATLASRVGIHVGDVVVWDNSSEDIAKGAKPVEVEGLVKPIASRLMSLALPGQILLSNIAYALAHRAQGELGIQLEKVRWRTHGRYRFRGIPDPVPVFEVGEDGVAPLKAPPWSSKAHREVPFWRRPATMVIEGLVLLALAAIPVVMFLRPEPAIAFANRDWVVVGNLQNLTGESVFDEALESALRIGLEQSRYVNVLPDLKVRDTVKRMQRDPDTTKVDRAIGSEVAIRDGAKALILPTIAEIGGRVRITAEVIDPRTLTTVYSESADGTGAESVLPSLDTINSRLRVRLGEALASVSEDSLPLEKVATKNLDALRAYSLGIQNNVRGKFNEALELYRQALRIDPEFSAAHMRIAGIFISAVRNKEAVEEYELALGHRERLSPREAMYAEVVVLSVRLSSEAFAKWAALAETYPDFFAGSGGFAYRSWADANRFEQKTVDMAQAAASSRNPLPLPALHLVGILNLGNEKFTEAEAVFVDAEGRGLVRTEYHAATFAAQRRFDLAASTFARSPNASATENPAVNSARHLFATSFALDKGDFSEAARLIARARDENPAGAPLSGLYEVASLTFGEPPQDPATRTASLRRALDASVQERAKSGGNERAAIDARILVVGYLAAAMRDATLASSALTVVGEGTYASYTTAYKLREVVQAQVDVAAGRHEQAIERLRRLLDGSELAITHVALLDAYVSAGRPRDASAEAAWLSSHRGRLYAEYNSANVLTVFNMEQSTLALLRAAELAATRADGHREARKLLGTFSSYWRDLDARPALAERVKRLQADLPPEAAP